MTETLETLKSRYRAINHKIDKLHMEAAEKTGILPLPEGKKFWTITEIDWNNPNLKNIKTKLKELSDKSYELENIIDKKEAEKQGNLSFYYAQQKAHKYLKENCANFEEEVKFFKKNNLPRGIMSFAEEITKNPEYINQLKKG